MRPRAKWALGLAIALAALLAVGVPLAFVGQSLRERYLVNADIRRVEQGGLPPEVFAGFGERLRVAAEAQGLTPRERARRLDAAAVAFVRAGRPGDARPLFRAEYELVRNAVPAHEVLWVLANLNGCLREPRTAPELAEVRENHAAIRALGPRVFPAGSSEMEIVRRSPSEFAGQVEGYVRRAGGALDPAARRDLLGEVVSLRDGATEPDDRAALASVLAQYADALDAAGDRAGAVAVRRRLRSEFADTVAGRTLPATPGGSP